MKKYLTLTLILVSFLINAQENRFTESFKEADSAFIAHMDVEFNDDFCSGHNDGWVDGFCSDYYPCSPPVAPACPAMRVGDEDTYKSGYKRGMRRGVKDRQKEEEGNG